MSEYKWHYVESECVDHNCDKCKHDKAQAGTEKYDETCYRCFRTQGKYCYFEAKAESEGEE
jgi:hypothetical protein